MHGGVNEEPYRLAWIGASTAVDGATPGRPNHQRSNTAETADCPSDAASKGNAWNSL
jgi:hypothetical protein